MPRLQLHFIKGGPSIGIMGKGRMPFPNPGGRGVPGGGGPPPQTRWRGQPQPTEAQPPTGINTSPTGAREFKNIY